MKDIILKITGRTITSSADSETQEDVMEFITEGRIYREGGKTFVNYEESELSGLDGCTTSLEIEDGKVMMKRSGEPMAVETVMEFEGGKRFEGLYQTPFGPVGMEILTNSVTVSDKENGEMERLRIDYDVSLRGLSQSRNMLDIEILQ